MSRILSALSALTRRMFTPAGPSAATADLHRAWVAEQMKEYSVQKLYAGPLDGDLNATGETYEMRLAYRKALKEPAIKGPLLKKVYAVASLTPQVLPEDGDHPAGKESAAWVDYAITHARGGWPRLLHDCCIHPLIEGFAVGEKVAERVERGKWKDRWGLHAVKFKETQNLRFKLDRYRNVESVRSFAGGQGGHEFDVRDFVLLTHMPLWENPFGQSDMRAAYRAINLIEASIKLRAILLENFSGPFLVYKNSQPARIEEARAALSNARSRGYIVIDAQDELAVVNLATSGPDQFQTTIDDLRKEAATAIAGAYLQMLESGSPQGNSETHKGVSELFEWWLASTVAAALTEQLVPDLHDPHYADDVGRPRILLGGVDPNEATKQAEKLKTAKGLGLPLSKGQAYEILELEPPRDAGDALGGDQPAQPGVGSAAGGQPGATGGQPGLPGNGGGGPPPGNGGPGGAPPGPQPTASGPGGPGAEASPAAASGPMNDDQAPMNAPNSAAGVGRGAVGGGPPVPPELLAAMVAAQEAGDEEAVDDLADLMSDPDALAAVTGGPAALTDPQPSAVPAGTPDWWGDEADADETGEPAWPDDDEAPLDEDDDATAPATPGVRTFADATGTGFTGEKKDRRGRRMCYADGKRVRCAPRPGEGHDPNKPHPSARFADNADHPPYASTGEAWDRPTWHPAGKTREGKLRWMHGDSGRVVTGDRPPEPSPARKQAAFAERERRLSQPATVYRPPDDVQPSVETAFGDRGKDGVADVLGLKNGTAAMLSKPWFGSGVSVTLTHPDVDQWSRTIVSNPDGTLTVKNNLFFLKPGARGGGFGTKAFADQVRGMVREGGKEIVTTAGKGGGGKDKMNGYYTWPRLGYDAPLEEQYRRKLPEQFRDARTVQDLMATREGAEHWKQTGYMAQMKFDTTPGSRSIQVLNRYLASKGEPPIDDGESVVQARAEKIAERRERVSNQPAAPPPPPKPVLTPPPPPPPTVSVTDPGEGEARRARYGQFFQTPDGRRNDGIGRQIAVSLGLDPGEVARAVEDRHLPHRFENAGAAMTLGYFRALMAAGMNPDDYSRLLSAATARVGRGDAVTSFADAVTFADHHRKEGEVWEGKSNRWYKRTNGRTVQVANPNAVKSAGRDSAAPKRDVIAEARAAKEAREPGREAARTRWRAAVQDPKRVTADQIKSLADDLKTLTRDELRDMGKALRMSGSGLKEDVVRRLLDHVGAKGAGGPAKATGQYGAWGRAAQPAVAVAQDSPAAPSAPTARPDGTPVAPEVKHVYTVDPKTLAVDPSRFQYKVSGIKEGGVTDELKGTSTWNPELGGTLLVWRDPADGKDYVINGHHRHELASRVGAEAVNVRYIEAPTAKEARARGALANIAEGRGTATDAAKYLRDSGQDIAHLKRAGISMSGRVAADAANLKDLSDGAFQKLTTGQLDEAKATAVARHLKDPALQDALFKKMDKREEEGKDWSSREIETAAKKMARAGKVTESGTDLFGGFEDEKSTFDQEVELETHIGRSLQQAANDYAAVSNTGRAERVKGAGNVLATDENQRRKQAAAGMVQDFERESGLRSPVSDAIQAAAAELAGAKTKRERDAIKQRAVEAVRGILDGGGQPAGGKPDPAPPDARGGGAGGAGSPGVGQPAAVGAGADATPGDAGRPARSKLEEGLNARDPVAYDLAASRSTSSATAPANGPRDTQSTRTDAEQHDRNATRFRTAGDAAAKRGDIEAAAEAHRKADESAQLADGKAVPTTHVGRMAAADPIRALDAMKPGTAAVVNGYHVTRNADGTYTFPNGEKAFRGGSAEDVRRWIREGWNSQVWRAKGAEAALNRADSAPESDPFDPASAARDAAERAKLASLPDGVEGVSTHGSTRGRIGTVKRGADGVARLHFPDSPAEFAADEFEPLEERHSWRAAEIRDTKPKAVKDQPGLFGVGDDDAPPATLADPFDTPDASGRFPSRVDGVSYGNKDDRDADDRAARKKLKTADKLTAKADAIRDQLDKAKADGEAAIASAKERHAAAAKAADDAAREADAAEARAKELAGAAADPAAEVSALPHLSPADRESYARRAASAKDPKILANILQAARDLSRQLGERASRGGPTPIAATAKPAPAVPANKYGTAEDADFGGVTRAEVPAGGGLTKLERNMDATDPNAQALAGTRTVAQPAATARRINLPATEAEQHARNAEQFDAQADAAEKRGEPAKAKELRAKAGDSRRLAGGGDPATTPAPAPRIVPIDSHPALGIAPPAARQAIASRIQAISYHDTPEDFDTALQANEFARHEGKGADKQKAEADSTLKFFKGSRGLYLQGHPHLYVTKNADLLASLKRRAETDHPDFAMRHGDLDEAADEVSRHEAAHALDNNAHSFSLEWRNLHQQEMARKGKDGRYVLSKQAAGDPREGFAEAIRVVYRSHADAAKFEKAFPKTAAYIKKAGLWPEPER